MFLYSSIMCDPSEKSTYTINIIYVFIHYKYQFIVYVMNVSADMA